MKWNVLAYNPANGEYFAGTFEGSAEQAEQAAKTAFKNMLESLGEPMLKKLNWRYIVKKYGDS